MNKIKIKNIFLFVLFLMGIFLLRVNYVLSQETNLAETLRPKVEYEAYGLRDPFENLVVQEAIDLTTEVIKDQNIIEEFTLPTLDIQGLVWGGAVSCAIINSRVYKVGDKIEDVKILDINKEGLELLYKGKRFSLPSSFIQKSK